MYQFFVEKSQIQDSKIVITGPDFNHIKNVLRMKIGEEILISNGMDQKEYHCKIAEYQEEIVECDILQIAESKQELPSKIYLFQGLPKADKMEWIIQKAVELGVFEIIPVSCKRSIVKLDYKKEKNKLTRWQGISEAAAKQSKRFFVPKIHELMSFSEAIEYAKEIDLKCIPYEKAEGMEETKAFFSKICEGRTIAVFIGPEGGFEPNEIEQAMKIGIKPITLGKRILRTETAGMTVLSWLMYQLES